MSARKPERAARAKCRNLTCEELREQDKMLSKLAETAISERRAVRREIRRRRSEQWAA